MTTPPVLSSGSTLSANVSLNSTGNNCKMISSDLELRIFQSGCYYMDTTDGSYKSDGTEVLADTNIHSTHCQVTHCTEFAGGFIVLPAPINFEEVFANASIDRNPIIYATVFTIIGLYVILAVVCRILDMRDKKKKGITMLNEDKMENLYEVIVFTGNRKDASTESNVHMIINGENLDSHIIRLYDKQRKLFRRGGVDTFIIATQR
jgi:polycystin 1L2